ncbi:hypothetical protein F2Q70_00008642 [Brassica cretica]|uniref:Uncharacterized protein n=1 Tax=Brassica cretica TaxID=69181 RepID=A0A8S9LX28_BRACR|nr:hypothetical protein F2Q70_00008642 [Brassica cretica]
MDESFSNLQTSHLLGSVPAVISEDDKKSTNVHIASVNEVIDHSSLQLPLLIPVEFLRWVIILLAGGASSCFVALNLRSYLEASNDLTVVLAVAFGLQMLPLLIPVEFLRWVIILLAGGASSCFVALNLRSYLEASNDLTVVLAVAFGLQMVLSIFIKVWLFP